MKKSIIFCQASAKVASVLNCYERELSKQRSVQIVIRNVPNLVKFFKSLNLKAEVLYFDRLYPRKLSKDVIPLNEVHEENDNISFINLSFLQK